MNIVHITAPAAVGGLEGVVRGLAIGQRERGHAVTVIAIGSEAVVESFSPALVSAGVRVVTIGLSNRNALRERFLVSEVVASGRADVVHTHGYRADILHLSRLSAAAARVTTLHGFTGASRRVRLYERVQLRSVARADAVVVVSSGLRSAVHSSGVAPDRVHLVRNAYVSDGNRMDRADSLTRLGLSSARFNVGWIGRLGSEKGPDVAIEAMAHLKDLPVTLSLLGDGADRVKLEARAQSLGMSGAVRFHGVVPNAAELLNAFDVVLISSRTEGTPLVLLEAMAAGVPLVATQVGGIPDVVSDREAKLVPPENPAALATALRGVLTLRAAAMERAERARLRVRSEFDAAAWLTRYEQVYKAARERAQG